MNPTKFRAEVKGTVGELFIYDSIGAGWYGGIDPKDIVDSIDRLKKDGATELHVFINSPGGRVFDGVTIYNAIRRFAGKRVTHVDGIAASIASVILMAGDERNIAKNAMVMIHNPSGICMGGAAEMRKEADVLDGLRETMVETYRERSGSTKPDIIAWMDAETWMSAEEARERGFCTAITGEKKEEESTDDAKAAMMSQFLAQYKRAPERAVRLMNMAAPQCKAQPALEEKQMNEQEKKAFEEMKAQVTELTAFKAEVAKIAGKDSPVEIAAVLSAQKEQSAQTAALVAQVAKYEAEKKQTSIVAMLDEASRDGRLTPANREVLMKADAPAFAKDPEGLKTYLAMLPKAPPAEAHKETQNPAVELTDTEKHMARQLGVTEEQVVARKKARAEKK